MHILIIINLIMPLIISFRFYNRIVKKPYFYSYKISGAELLIKKFEQNNITTVFAYPGGANLVLFDALYNSSIKVITNRHEQFGGYAAEGYAKSSNTIGVIITTSGPGLTNIITPLQDALSDGIPILAISGQVSNDKLGTSAFQECNATAITKTCVKYNKLISNISELEQSFDRSIQIALSDRKGPVHLDICSNVFSEKTYLINKNKKVVNFNYYYDRSIDLYKIDLIYKLILQSKKPVLIVGNGCKYNYKEVRKFINKFNLPTTTTLHGLGIVDENDYKSLKMCGMHGSYAANMAIQNADLIIGIGNRFDDRTIGNKNLYGINAKKNYGIIHIDSCSNKIDEVNKIISPNISVNIESDEFFNIINQKPNKFASIHSWYNKISIWKNKHSLNKYSNTNTSLSIPFICQKLSYELHKNNKRFIITTGVGVHQMQVAQYFTWTHPNSIITSGSQGTMGVGLPFALGAKLAQEKIKNKDIENKDIENKDIEVICIDGDGSFMMSCQELQTLSEYNIKIKILIMDNNNLQMVSNWQEKFYSKRYSSSKLTNPDFVKLSEAMGTKAITCDNIEYLDSTINYIINTNNSLLVHFKINNVDCLPFVPPNNALDNMIIK